MSTTALPTAARPQAVAIAARPRRTAAVLTLVAALLGGTTVALAPQAHAAPAKAAVTAAAKPTPRLAISVNRTKVVKGQQTPTVRVRASKDGAKLGGRARLVVNGRSTTAHHLKKGTTTFAVAAKYLRTGKNTIRVRVNPSRPGLYTATSTAKTVRATPGGSPVVKVAKRYVGVPDRSGGSTPSGFDCSGFTKYVYKKAGVKNLPRTSSGQRHAGHRVSRANAKPGDLIWTPGHVAIYVGKGMQIDAPRPGKTIQVRRIWQDNPTFLRVSAKAIGV
jgi:cell wall-associated NlpC family hydrolase